jgi:predicted TIM-barrel fold metal-dependent hydrolase
VLSPDEFMAWDPSRSYEEVFGEMLKRTPCANRVLSPLTDEDLKNRTIEVMTRNNVYGVFGGTHEGVAEWMRAAPGRFYPGYDFTFGADAPPLDTLKAWHSDGRLAVLAEIMNQYEGIEPLDPRMEPYWALCDVGVLAFTRPRAGFYRYLRAIFDAGFGTRVMFGSDQMVWPEAIERSIAAINEAPFLSAKQKRDVFYNNAARFFRLSEEEIARHSRQ